MPDSTTADAVASPGPVPASERIELLDILRGLALFGMLLVHATYYVDGEGALHGGVLTAIGVLAESKFYTLFSLLFGISFAVQMLRAEARGSAFLPLYLRRLAGLGLIGLATYLLLGYWVLVLYTLWGGVLLVFRRAPPRVLVVAALFFLCAPALYHTAAGTYGLVVHGRANAEAVWERYAAERRAELGAIRQQLDEGTFAEVVGARWDQLVFRVWTPRLWLSWDPFLFFLLGMLAVRAGVVHDLERRRGLLRRVAWAGLGLFAVAVVVNRLWAPTLELGNVRFTVAAESLLWAVGEHWLAFAYAGGLALLYLGDPRWRERLQFLAPSGRAALSNYVLQLLVLELLFSRFGLDLPLAAWLAPAFVITFFGVQAALSQWWLLRFRMGPLEWAWRSFTYGEMQPLRIPRPVPVGLGA